MANSVLSIYVGVDAIRVAEVQYNGKTVTLANAAEIATPEKSVTDGYIDEVTMVSEAIRQAIFGRGFKSKDVIFTIASKKIASKEVTIPFIKGEKKMQSVLQANSSEYFPMSNSGDYSFAYTLLEDYSDAEGHKCRVSAVACPVDLIKGYYDLAKELKFKVKSIDYFGNSVLQLLSMQMTPGRVDLVLQIENDQTIVNVMRGATLVFQRSVSYGKNSVISSLMDVKKISEKDAKTLLSREDYMDQYVTDDEYSAALEGMINGIKKAVEYYRNKSKDENLQGIKVFGEGSALANIGKLLEKELGASVEFFDNLAGVIVKGQAALKASEVLRYLPNMGAVIKPVNLVGYADDSTGSSMDNALIIKVLKIVLAVAAVVMIGFVAYTIYDADQANKRTAELNAQIALIQDIEEIANAYDNAELELGCVKDFEASTHSDNDLLLDLILEMEKRFPTDTAINEVESKDGELTFQVKSGWHTTVKNELSDVIINLNELDYINNLVVPKMEEEYEVRFIEGYDEKGNIIYLREEPTDDGELGAYIVYDSTQDIDEEMQHYIDTYERIALVQVTYDVECHLGYPVVEEPAEEEAVVEGEVAATEEGGAE